MFKVQRTFFKAFKILRWDGPSSPNRVELRVMVMVKALWLKWAQFFESFQKIALNLELWLWFKWAQLFETWTLVVSHSRLWLKSNANFSKLSKICAELRVIVMVNVQRKFFKPFKNLRLDGPSSPNWVELRVMVMVKVLWLKWAQFFESFQKFALNLGLWLWFELKHFLKATKKSALSHENGLEVPSIPIPNPESLCLMPILTLIPISKL